MNEKMDKNCQYRWKIVEMDENMIDECINPQYWWTHSIWCIQYSEHPAGSSRHN
jgi:hypothetical protein